MITVLVCAITFLELNAISIQKKFQNDKKKKKMRFFY